LPAARNAHIVLSSLKAWCLEHHVTFRYRSPVGEILTASSHASGVRVNERSIGARAIILATGGMSYPGTGSTGDGYALAESLGHRIVSPVPGLVPLVASDAWIASLAGVSLTDVGLAARQGTSVLGQRRGGIVFTRDGLSGPTALDLSLDISRAFSRGSVLLSMDLLPDTSFDALDAELARAFQAAGGSSLARVLGRWLPASMVAMLLKLTGVEATLPVAQLSATRRRHITETLKGLELHLIGTRPIQEAMVTLGGISSDEIDPSTMASRRVRGLYMAGEVIDVAGDTGGYNLQAAFASGRLAGESAASD
jgi:predicted Rossmann fold flavoprotein